MNSDTTVFEKPPLDFAATLEVVATYVHLDGKVLFLKLSPNKREAGKWGVPAGKLDAGETPVVGAKRELFEETGLDIDVSLFKSLKALYMRKPDMDYIYHLFSVNVTQPSQIYLSPEHCTYQWVTQSEAHSLPLMGGAKEPLDIYFKTLQI
ncbi:MAG: NUDIX hydrolase [Chlamydiales bacterium]|nr:NUDIX hydrolase [Chlamydiales bacterium]